MADQSIHGHRVVDQAFVDVGTVTDVVYDNREMEPRWAVVKTGLIGGERYVPLKDSYVADDGRLVVPYYRASIKRAPRPNREHVITTQDEKELRDYYGVAA
jgi:hypothetical protein